jgi:hypothetical protein
VKTDVCSQLESALEPLDCDALARSTGFCRRSPKKLPPLTFVQSACLLLTESVVSLRRWAMLIGLLTNLTYSKQSLFERLNQRAVNFLQRVLQALLATLSLGQQRVLPPELDTFKRVIIEDSTLLTLSPKLAQFFPGSRNQSSPGRQSQLRLQTFHELKHEHFLYFGHSAFNRNDLSAAEDGLELLRPGDLFMRDLGYLVLPVLRRLQEAGIHYLSRFKHNLRVFEPGGQPLDLAELLRHRTHPLDKDVLIGAKEQLPVRLVAIPLTEELANQRRHQAKHNRHFHASRQHVILAGWEIFITNVGRDVWSSPKAVAKIYHLRWRIETIFKAWKSHFNLESAPAGSRVEVEAFLYARLLLITIFQVCFLARWDYRFQSQTPTGLSLLKVAAFFPLCLSAGWLAQLQPHLEAALLKQVRYHCTYEQRTKRQSYLQMLKLT